MSNEPKKDISEELVDEVVETAMKEIEEEGALGIDGNGTCGNLGCSAH